MIPAPESPEESSAKRHVLARFLILAGIGIMFALIICKP